jgi:hypothetical protein
MPNSEAWQAIAKKEEKTKYSESGLANIMTLTGDVKVGQNEESTVFCSKMQAFIENYNLLYSEVIACGKDIHLKSNDLAETVDGLVKAFEALSELQKVIKEDRLTNIFN